MVIMMFNNVELSLFVDTLLKPVIVLQAGFGPGQLLYLVKYNNVIPSYTFSISYLIWFEES